jgi:hypothetical protein
MTKLDDLRDSSRQRANDLFRKAKKESAAQTTKRDKERAAEAEKTARLRELRLAKESSGKA